jgi:cellobiose phosphorylase
MTTSPSTHGYFTEDGLEYVVTSPHTPHRDWFNFFWNPTYLACASQNMNGCSLYQNDAGVVTNLFGKQDMRDDPRWIYVRDNATGEYWSAGYFPCWTEHDSFTCRNGLGYSILRTLKNGIQLEFRVFVPRHDAGEIWTVHVTNESDRPRDLSIFTAANIMLDGAQMTYGYFGGISGKYEPKEGFLFYKNTTYTVVDEKYRAFMYSDVAPDRWDTSREHFLGKDRNFSRPQGVVDGALRNSVASVEYLIGALQHNLSLAPGQKKTINYVLGVVLNLAEARQMKKAFATSAKIEKEFQAMKAENIARLGGLRLQSPDSDFDNLLNTWLKHQLYLMADWARFYFKGYRDTCQDSAGMSVINPPRAWEMLKKALRNQTAFVPARFAWPAKVTGARTNTTPIRPRGSATPPTRSCAKPATSACSTKSWNTPTRARARSGTITSGPSSFSGTTAAATASACSIAGTGMTCSTRRASKAKAKASG